ncbi:hypothetical protein J6590_071032 [Homalodisca vitripennis]|nr:hypothetical protein J6590_071032 [Homalodisca vitripennis]
MSINRRDIRIHILHHSIHHIHHIPIHHIHYIHILLHSMDQLQERGQPEGGVAGLEERVRPCFHHRRGKEMVGVQDERQDPAVVLGKGKVLPRLTRKSQEVLEKIK